MTKLRINRQIVEGMMKRMDDNDEALSKAIVDRIKDANIDNIYRAIYVAYYRDKNSDIKDLVECAEFDHPNHIALRKIGEERISKHTSKAAPLCLIKQSKTIYITHHKTF